MYNRRTDVQTSQNAINNDYYYGRTGNTIKNRVSEYSPQNFKCGLSTIRNKPKNNLWDMLRIIGGRTSRKGQWPWQVVILNKFKVQKLALFFFWINGANWILNLGGNLWRNINLTVLGADGRPLRSKEAVRSVG